MGESFGLRCIGVIFVCGLLQGCIGYIAKGDPRWETSLVSADCNSIDGVYRSKINLSKDGEWLSRVNDLRPMIFDRVNVNVGECFDGVCLKKRPIMEELSILSGLRNWNNVVYLKSYKEGWEIFFKGQEDFWDEKLIAKRNADFVGCNYEGDIVFRSLETIFGAEFTPGSAYAQEIVLKRLVDGRLQVTFTRRRWTGSMNKSPDGSYRRIFVFDAIN